MTAAGKLPWREQEAAHTPTSFLKQVKKTDIRRPNIKIDRTKARWESDHDPTGENSIFGQIYTALGSAASTNAIFRGADRWWTVSFVNEHVSDAGGGFRETVSNISDDLNSTRTPLFIPTPNASAEEGDMRDAWMPSPGEYTFISTNAVATRMTPVRFCNCTNMHSSDCVAAMICARLH